MKYGILKDVGLDTQHYAPEDLADSYFRFYPLTDSAGAIASGNGVLMLSEKHKWQRMIIGFPNGIPASVAITFEPPSQYFARPPLISNNITGVTILFDHETHRLDMSRGPGYVEGQSSGHVIIEGMI